MLWPKESICPVDISMPIHRAILKKNRCSLMVSCSKNHVTEKNVATSTTVRTTRCFDKKRLFFFICFVPVEHNAYIASKENQAGSGYDKALVKIPLRQKLYNKRKVAASVWIIFTAG